MPNTPELEMLRSAETAVLKTLSDGKPQRIGALAEAVRIATTNPQFPDPIVITAICNLSNLGKIIQSFSEGFLFYSLASGAPASASELAPTPTKDSHD